MHTHTLGVLLAAVGNALAQQQQGEYSPFFDSRIACAASSYFGLVGNGRLFILALTPDGIVAEKWCASASHCTI